MAQFNASQLITQRQQVSLMVKNQLIDKARDFHFLIDDVAIVKFMLIKTDLSFSQEYTAAVEAKQIGVLLNYFSSTRGTKSRLCGGTGKTGKTKETSSSRRRG